MQSLKVNRERLWSLIASMQRQSIQSSSCSSGIFFLTTLFSWSLSPGFGMKYSSCVCQYIFTWHSFVFPRMPVAYSGTCLSQIPVHCSARIYALHRRNIIHVFPTFHRAPPGRSISNTGRLQTDLKRLTGLIMARYWKKAGTYYYVYCSAAMLISLKTEAERRGSCGYHASLVLKSIWSICLQ